MIQSKQLGQLLYPIVTLSMFAGESQVIRYRLPTCMTSPPFGEVMVSHKPVWVAVAVGVTVLVIVGVTVNVGVEVIVGVSVGVSVGAMVGVSVAVSVGVVVGVSVSVSVGVKVGV